MPATRKERPRRAGEPWIVDRGARRVAVVRTSGPPIEVADEAVPALYRAVYSLKMRRKREGRDFKVEPLRARWPGGEAAPPHGAWALPLPDDIRALAGNPEVCVEVWEYGPTAEIVHAGPRASEPDSIHKLLAFVRGLGYDVAGPLEEEYLTRPDADAPRTIIRYPVRRHRAGATVDG